MTRLLLIVVLLSAICVELYSAGTVRRISDVRALHARQRRQASKIHNLPQDFLDKLSDAGTNALKSKYLEAAKLVKAQKTAVEAEEPKCKAAAEKAKAALKEMHDEFIQTQCGPCIQEKCSAFTKQCVLDALPSRAPTCAEIDPAVADKVNGSRVLGEMCGYYRRQCQSGEEFSEECATQVQASCKAIIRSCVLQQLPASPPSCSAIRATKDDSEEVRKTKIINMCKYYVRECTNNQENLFSDACVDELTAKCKARIQSCTPSNENPCGSVFGFICKGIQDEVVAAVVDLATNAADFITEDVADFITDDIGGAIEDLGDVFGDIGENIGDVFGDIGDNIGDAFDGIGDTFGDALSDLGDLDIFSDIGDSFTGAIGGIGDIGGGIADFGRDIGRGLGDIGSNVGDFSGGFGKRRRRRQATVQNLPSPTCDSVADNEERKTSCLYYANECPCVSPYTQMDIESVCPAYSSAKAAYTDLYENDKWILSIPTGQLSMVFSSATVDVAKKERDNVYMTTFNVVVTTGHSSVTFEMELGLTRETLQATLPAIIMRAIDTLRN